MSLNKTIISRQNFLKTLSRKDCCSYKVFELQIPQHCDEIRIRFSYTPYFTGEYRNLITLALFDPESFRGWVYPFAEGRELVISHEYASDGLLRGVLPSGKWYLQAALTALVSEEECLLSFDVEYVSFSGSSDEGGLSVSSVPSEKNNSKQNREGAGSPGWYRGELHSHTVHSDGQWSVGELFDNAEKRGLDFIMLTDHNTISGWKDPDLNSCRELLVIPSLEITSFFGHALALGIDRWVDCRIGWDDWSMDDAARAVHEAGGLFIVAHPNAIGRPVCAGCKWEFDDFDFNLADGIEIWSMAWDDPESGNELSLNLWEGHLNNDLRLTATSACDVHDETAWHGNKPSTYIYAESLTKEGILSGIKSGRVVLSDGPWLSISAYEPGAESRALIGDRLEITGNEITLIAEYQNVEEDCTMLIKNNGLVASEVELSRSGISELKMPLTGDCRFMAEIRRQNGTLSALTNPIYINCTGR